MVSCSCAARSSAAAANQRASEARGRRSGPRQRLRIGRALEHVCEVAFYARFVPAGVPAAAIFAGIVPYAMFNAAFEELVWRGVALQACTAEFGATFALLLSSLSFGLAHYRGFPSGALGVLLATIYGLMMGIVRIRSNGLFGPWLAPQVAGLLIPTRYLPVLKSHVDWKSV